MDPAKDIVGFVGTGVMGASMAGHLLKAGYRVHVTTRTKAKAKALIDAGAVWEEDPAVLAPKCTAIISMVGYPADVEQVYFGPAGLIEKAKPGSLLIDTTTSRPDLAKRIYDAAAKKGLHALDAPVSGGDVGAKNATLTIMVGGDEAAFTAAKPLLDIMGKTVILQGPAGAGQHTKMANQIVIAGNLICAVEAIMYARGAGLEPRRVLQSIGSGSAGSWQLNTMVPRMLDGDFAPGFYVKHFLKDLRIALESAKDMKIELPLLGLAERLFAVMQEEKFGDRGTQALYLLYEQGKVSGALG
ncbi:MAG TPA: NAD(P)-dependent oxidoreductase [Rectinemataceae bacterium]|nr:NAD(P)-dependent oxidoreductase [Rectinemataceae bacterium]